MATNGEEYDGPSEAETSFEVHLYIYDLSKELAKSFKKILKGKPLPGIWHTGLVAYGREYYFASSGIESCRPGETILGEPDQIMTLGKTELPYSVFLEYIFALGESTYKPGSYNLLEHNCNNFSQEVSNFLTGGPIPEELREVPQDILSNKTLSNSLREYFDKLNLRAEGSKGISFGTVSERNSTRATAASSDTVNGEVIVNGQHNSHQSSQQNSHKTSKSSKNKSHNNNTEQQAKMSSQGDATTSKKEQQKTAAAATNSVDPVDPISTNSTGISEVQKSNESVPSATERPQETSSAAQGAPETNGAANASMTDAFAEAANGDSIPVSRQLRSSMDDAESSDNMPTFTSRRSRKYQDPAMLFPDVDGIGSYQKIMDTVGQCLTSDEKHSMAEMLDYLTSPEGGAWALGSPHLDAIGRLLNDRNFPDEIPVLTLQMLQMAALKEDVILLLHQDREHHHIMSYLYRIENLPVAEQEEIATFMCNLCSNTSSFDWLMYISEWVEDGKPCNNSKVTVRVAVHSLLSDASKNLRDKGSALIYNLALKELFDDVATELAMAILQVLHGEISEEIAFRCLTALQRFMAISYNELPALMKMLGPDVKKFFKMSERVNQLAEEIHTKLSVTTFA